jgi:glycosyltransferase involved in cell wall biosynthesis
MSPPDPKVSIVIPCYNYGRYVHFAVDSALAQTYPHVEIIVVDDGSTDDTPRVLERYAGRIVRIRQDNGGHVAAVNRGYAAATGDLILFLDADDVLHPEAIAKAVAAWVGTCTKVQFDLEIIDANGQRLQRRFCNFSAGYDSAQIADEFARFGTYVWPVLSGNIYSRWYLDEHMPLRVPRAPDGVLNTLAPLYGPVRVITKPLGYYRLHDANLNYQGAADDFATRFGSRVKLRLRELEELRQHAARRGQPLPPGNLLDYDIVFVNFRLMLRRLGASYPGSANESALGLWRKGMAMLCKRRLSNKMRLAHAMWLTALLLSPPPLARRLIAARFHRKPILRTKQIAASSGAASHALPAEGHRNASDLTELPLISVIIPNYNYAAYLADAIDSALGLDWPHVEVIVIDDGSTDSSREILARYGSRIKAILQENSGQLVACNKGFALSRGEIVIFLDSDDVLAPELAREVFAVWTPSVSKVQVQMRCIDSHGRPMGNVFPQYAKAPTPQEIRAWAAASSAYPTPPGSGNVYARWFLERIFPLEDTCGTANDSYCLAAAPFLGDVITIPKPLVSYRIHGRNQGALLHLDTKQFARQMTRARLRRKYACTIAASVGMTLREDAVDLSLTYLCYRASSLKLAPATHPLSNDSTLRCLRDFVRAFFTPQGLSLRARLSLLAWGWAVCLLPVAPASRLILWRFAPGARPPALRTLLGRLKVLRV